MSVKVSEIKERDIGKRDILSRLLEDSVRETENYKINESGHEHSEAWKAAHTACLEEHHLTEQDMEAIIKNPSAVDMKFKCFTHCIFERTDYLDPQGKVNLEKAVADDEIDEEKLELIKQCKVEHDDESDACEYGFKMISCVMNGSWSHEAA